MALLALLGLILGGVGGVAAYLIVHLVGLISNLALLHRVGFNLPDLQHYHPSWVLVPITLSGAVVVVGLAKWRPIIKGHGIPESLEAILFRESRVAPRAALAKPVSAAVAMGTGGPFGAEGPIIVTGASIGSLVGQLFPVSPAERRILLATGAAAGMAGVFATPVAAVILAFELLLFERSLRALLPLSVATAVATALHEVLISSHPLFPLDYTPHVPASQLPLFVVVGLAAGVLAVVLNRGLFAVEDIFRRLPVPEWSHPIIGALGYALIGLGVPGSLSVGYWAITDAINGRFLLGAAAALFVAKMFSWWVGLGSNTSGGTLAPMFLVGACMGEMIGIGFAHTFPGAHIQPGAFALVGMGVTFGVGARALLTGVVFAAEVTGGFGLLLPLLLATAVAEIVVEQGLSERIMTDKLFRRGFRVDFDTQTDPLRMRIVAAVMEPIPKDQVALEVEDHDELTDSSLSRGSGTPARVSENTHAAPIAPSCPDPTVDRWAFLADALPSLLRPGCSRVAVTDRGQVVGYVTRKHVDVELRRRASEEVIEPPTLRWPKLSSIARRPPVDASTSAGSEPVVEQDQPERSPIQP
jgi:H+/Cl- antiporter ClcA